MFFEISDWNKIIVRGVSRGWFVWFIFNEGREGGKVDISGLLYYWVWDKCVGFGGEEIGNSR